MTVYMYIYKKILVLLKSWNKALRAIVKMDLVIRSLLWMLPAKKWLLKQSLNCPHDILLATKYTFDTSQGSPSVRYRPAIIACFYHICRQTAFRPFKLTQNVSPTLILRQWRLNNLIVLKFGKSQSKTSVTEQAIYSIPTTRSSVITKLQIVFAHILFFFIGMITYMIRSPSSKWLVFYMQSRLFFKLLCSINMSLLIGISYSYRRSIYP